VQRPTRGEAPSEKDGAPRAAVVESRGGAFGTSDSGEARTAGLTAAEVIALGLVGLLALVALGSLLLVLAFV
jgi:hypothetical protein